MSIEKLNFAENQSKCGIGQQKIWETCIFSEAKREGRIGCEKKKSHGERLHPNCDVSLMFFAFLLLFNYSLNYYVLLTSISVSKLRFFLQFNVFMGGKRSFDSIYLYALRSFTFLV